MYTISFWSIVMYKSEYFRDFVFPWTFCDYTQNMFMFSPTVHQQYSLDTRTKLHSILTYINATLSYFFQSTWYLTSFFRAQNFLWKNEANYLGSSNSFNSSLYFIFTNHKRSQHFFSRNTMNFDCAFVKKAVIHLKKVPV